MKYVNQMQKPRIAKVIVNIGIGKSGEELVKAEKLLTMLTTRKPVRTTSKCRIQTWSLRKGDSVGCKVTLRDKDAEDFLKRGFYAKDDIIKKRNFDNRGNFAFGIHEYIDIQGVKYEPDIGIFGMDIAVCIERPGYRVKRRRIKNSRIPEKNTITKDEAIEFITEKFNVTVE